MEEDPKLAHEYEKATRATRFAVALAMQREQLGLTQQQLAKLAGVSQPMLARYEKGQIPKVATLQRLAAALNTQVLLSSDDIKFESINAPGMKGTPKRNMHHNRKQAVIA